MRTVNVETTSGKYDVVIGNELDYGELLKKVHPACHLVLVSDDSVYALHGERTVKSLENAGFNVDTFVFPHGEASKNIHVAEKILEFCGDKHLTRTDLMVALGGGVVGDITGFCSAIMLRGVDFIQIPTTLLAAVDSSVGGKTGVDLNAGKNLAGAFHQPIAVFLDTDTFKTLPKETFAEGMAESIKYGMIRDEELFKIFENGSYDIEDIVARCVQNKADVVKIDEFDNGLRRTLNFGHTPGHAMEKISGFKISHGNAVAIGMVMMTRLSEKLGKLPQGSVDRLIKVLKSAGLPVECPYDAKILASNSLSDKKRTGDTLALILLDKIGEACIEKIDVEKIEEYYAKGLDEA